MSNHSGWQQLAHVTHHMSEKDRERTRKAAMYTLVGLGVVYGVSALTGFQPGVDVATSLLNANTGPKH